MTLVGDLSRAEAEKIAAALTSDLPGGDAATLPPVPGAPAKGWKNVAHPASQQTKLPRDRSVRRRHATT